MIKFNEFFILNNYDNNLVLKIKTKMEGDNKDDKIKKENKELKKINKELKEENEMLKNESLINGFVRNLKNLNLFKKKKKQTIRY
jgi:hypothetical protein